VELAAGVVLVQPCTSCCVVLGNKYYKERKEEKKQ
jgi:hypothetical protein